ncbi:hypothetical protein JXC34_01590, partial [Candidatus Woesearchaeota archaeon]|nr:hypothetical protein [Candidatus Woesearchaeota archaeon]
VTNALCPDEGIVPEVIIDLVSIVNLLSLKHYAKAPPEAVSIQANAYMGKNDTRGKFDPNQNFNELCQQVQDGSYTTMQSNTYQHMIKIVDPKKGEDPQEKQVLAYYHHIDPVDFAMFFESQTISNTDYHIQISANLIDNTITHITFAHESDDQIGIRFIFKVEEGEAAYLGACFVDLRKNNTMSYFQDGPVFSQAKDLYQANNGTIEQAKCIGEY